MQSIASKSNQKHSLTLELYQFENTAMDEFSVASPHATYAGTDTLAKAT